MTYGDSVESSPDEIWGRQTQERNENSLLHGLHTIYKAEQEDPRAHATMEPIAARRARLAGYGIR
jgi:hypothetical protein